MGDDKLTPKDALEHAWRYFALHAGQRMSLFNYFLIMFGIASAGLAGCLRAEGVLRLVGALLGGALASVAFVFWKLEQRSSFLVKHAETALLELEERHIAVESARLFRLEPAHTQTAQAVKPRATRVWTYGKSFRFLFALAAAVGIIGFAFSISLYVGWCE
jgi:hypothetical protein